MQNALMPAVAMLLALWVPAMAQAPVAPPPVSVAKPVVKEIVEWDDFIGRFEAVDDVEIRARVSGYLDRIYFADGAMVKVGDPLFTVDQRPYKAALDQAEATVASAQVRTEFASNDLERAETLRRTGNIAEQILDQRRSNYLTARADLDRARAGLTQARLEMDFTEIKSPDRRPDLAPARLARQPRQRQPDAAHEHRVDRSDLLLLRRR
jgi:multidrug efflux pump subunit AcrA (membrane-fusion protein)